jgi:hypothetical protein
MLSDLGGPRNDDFRPDALPLRSLPSVNKKDDKRFKGPMKRAASA